jgi:hypothetical protein
VFSIGFWFLFLIAKRTLHNRDENLETEGLRSSVWRVLRYFEKKGSIPSAQKVWDEICSVRFVVSLYYFLILFVFYSHYLSPITQVVVRSILCAEHEMVTSVRKFVKLRNTCFDLLGYDILLDEHTFKPYILEINHSPSMAPLTAMENEIKEGMLRDYFALADLTLEHREKLRRHVLVFIEKIKQLRVPGEAEYQLEDFVALHDEQVLQMTRLSEFDVFSLVNGSFVDCVVLVISQH